VNIRSGQSVPGHEGPSAKSIAIGLCFSAGDGYQNTRKKTNAAVAAGAKTKSNDLQRRSVCLSTNSPIYSGNCRASSCTNHGKTQPQTYVDSGGVLLLASQIRFAKSDLVCRSFNKRQWSSEIIDFEKTYGVTNQYKKLKCQLGQGNGNLGVLGIEEEIP